MSNINVVTLKRINGDFKLFNKSNPKYFDIYPNNDTILEIWFLLYGLENTPYEGGQYIGKIVHSPEYPLKAPDFFMYTPNGRFHCCKKICLTNSSYHQESWTPGAWNLVSMLEGLFSIWNSDIKEDLTGIGHLKTGISEIKILAKQSIDYNMTVLSNIYNSFPKVQEKYNPYTKVSLEPKVEEPKVEEEPVKKLIKPRAKKQL